MKNHPMTTPEINEIAECPQSFTNSLQEIANEMEAVGQFMSDAFLRAVCYKVRYAHKSREEAESEVLYAPLESVAERIMNTLPGRVTYLDMIKLQAKDPLLAAQRWATIRQRAVDSWQSGENHAGAISQTDQERVWRQANFIAVRESLAGGNTPRNGMELELLNQMTQLHILQMDWMKILSERTNRDLSRKSGSSKSCAHRN